MYSVCLSAKVILAPDAGCTALVQRITIHSVCLNLLLRASPDQLPPRPCRTCAAFISVGVARPTGVERADAINIRIPIERAEKTAEVTA
jgi:hypothetical protein